MISNLRNISTAMYNAFINTIIISRHVVRNQEMYHEFTDENGSVINFGVYATKVVLHDNGEFHEIILSDRWMTKQILNPFTAEGMSNDVWDDITKAAVLGLEYKGSRFDVNIHPEGHNTILVTVFDNQLDDPDWGTMLGGVHIIQL